MLAGVGATDALEMYTFMVIISLADPSLIAVCPRYNGY